MRKKIAAGNWKMNTLIDEGKKLASEIFNLAKNENFDTSKYGIIIAPPFTHLYPIGQIIDNEKVILAAQNVAAYEKGAYTGEVSAAMLASVGVKAVIIGHSERRSYFREDNETLLAKIKLALKYDLQPIFCIGEVLEEREKNNHFRVIENQLKNVAFLFGAKEFEKFIIAYEPVWAIGTGKTATPGQAQEMHAFIRNLIADNYDSNLAENTAILYGGSVKPHNAKDLFSQKDVDGGLVGGASLKAQDFWEIFKALQ